MIKYSSQQDKGQLAQLVEPLVYTQVVGSSSLSLPIFRDVAQLVARLVWDQDVAGSNPVIPTNFLSEHKAFKSILLPKNHISRYYFGLLLFFFDLSKAFL